MRKTSTLGLALVGLLLLGSAVWAVRLARHYPAARVELSRIKTTALADDTVQKLHALHDKLFLTYYVSPREKLPSHMRRLEEQVRELCEALRREAPERVDYQIVDPGSHPDFERYAAKRKASPVRVRSIERDAYSDRTVWSTLTIAYGPHPAAVVNGLSPEHMPRLQALVLAHLDQMESPQRPTIALAAPESRFRELRADLESAGPDGKIKAKVMSFDLAGRTPLPVQADVLFWLDPQPVEPARLRELELYLASGHSIVIAGSAFTVETLGQGDGAALVYKPTGYPAEAILSRFCLAPVKGLVFDQFGEKLVFGGSEREVPCLVRCIAPNQDFHTLKGQPNGNLLFNASTALALDGEKLERAGLRAEILATTTDKTWLLPEPAPGATPLPLSELSPEKGESAPKQPLIVSVRSDDPTRGILVACASSSPFQDGMYKRESTAHWRLLKTLVDSLGSDERLVQNKVGVLRPDPVPELSAGQRTLWRVLCVLLLPALFLALALRRGAFGRGAARGLAGLGRTTRVWRPIVLRTAAGLLVVLLATAGARALAASVDLSHEGLNQLAPESRTIARAAREVAVELCFSTPDRLPPPMRAPVSRVKDALRAFQRAGAGLSVESLAPSEPDAAERARLTARGYVPIAVSTRDEEVTTVRSVYSAIRLSAGGRSEHLKFPDVDSFEQLEFRLAFALWRLQTGRQPQVAFASDVPRLSAAQAFDYQQAGLFAPMGSDVYSLARELISRCDFDVVHVNPRDPKMPEQPDCLVWLQPRRAVETMYEQLVAYLHRGGHVFLSSQHFLMESRQFPGTNFVFNYWPRPESPDVELYYFPEIGARLVRQPFFDDLFIQAPIESQVKKGAQITWTYMDAAQPFMVRTSAANYAPDSPVMRGLGDQATLFAAAFELDHELLRAHGLSAKPLIASSERAWSFDWKGGWIPKSMLAWPPSVQIDHAQDGSEKRVEPVLRPKAPLAIEISGRFPYPEKRILKPQPVIGPDGQPAESQPAPIPYPSSSEDPGAPGRLVWIGSSEMFKNHRLREPEFRADQLLLNAVASLALPEELAHIASRRLVPRGYGFIEPDQRLRWRAFVLGAFPIALVLYGLLRAALLRSRRPRSVLAPSS